MLLVSITGVITGLKLKSSSNIDGKLAIAYCIASFIVVTTLLALSAIIESLSYMPLAIPMSKYLPISSPTLEGEWIPNAFLAALSAALAAFAAAAAAL